MTHLMWPEMAGRAGQEVRWGSRHLAPSWLSSQLTATPGLG
jgi:hypothetical protein